MVIGLEVFIEVWWRYEVGNFLKIKIIIRLKFRLDGINDSLVVLYVNYYLFMRAIFKLFFRIKGKGIFFFV